MTGEYFCSQPNNECLYPVPALGLDERIVFKWFQECQSQWNSVGTMSYERRTGIPFSDAKIAAETLGVRFNTQRLRQFLSCVNAIVSDDIQSIKIASKKNP